MIRSKKVLHPRIASVWLVLLLIAVQASGATAMGCTTTDRYGDERACTATERIGECLYNAGDSYEQCMEEEDGFWDRVKCGSALVIDSSECLFDYFD